MFVKLEDTKSVHFLTTIHGPTITDTRKRDRGGKSIKKLTGVHDYNLNMGGVDRNGGMISFYTATRKTQKRYKKLQPILWKKAQCTVAKSTLTSSGLSTTHYLVKANVS
eukprot:scpid90064/ scgid11080/ 